MPDSDILGQLLILSSTQVEAVPYVDAAEKLAVDYTVALESSSHPAHAQPAVSEASVLRLSFAQRESALEIVQYAMDHPLTAIVAADERCAPSCARAASMIGLPCNPPKAADACLDKFVLRQKLSNAGIRTPMLGDPPAGRELAVAVVLDRTGGKTSMRVLGIVEGGHAATNVPKHALETILRATRVVMLSQGPVFAELRLAADEAWVIDLAPAIPMRLSTILRFHIPLVDEDVTLAEIIVRHALGMDVSRIYLQK